MSCELVMLFWTDGVPDSTRTRNCKFAWNYLQRLEDHAQSHGVDIKCRLIDHSPEQLVIGEQVTHDPYPLGVYKRSEKINKALNSCSADFFGVMDSDAFFHPDSGPEIIELLDNLTKSNVYTFDLKDVTNYHEVVNFNDNTINLSDIEYASRFPGDCNPGLGGFFICCTETLKSKEGFNENFETWGGEDGDCFSKMWDDPAVHTHKVDIDLYHIPHFCDRENILYFNRDEYKRLNNLQD